MTIHVTDCTTGKPLYLATITDIYGGVSYTDAYGNVQVVPGSEQLYYGTEVTISDGLYPSIEVTLASYEVNSFCLTPRPATGTGSTGSGPYGPGIY